MTSVTALNQSITCRWANPAGRCRKPCCHLHSGSFDGETEEQTHDQSTAPEMNHNLIQIIQNISSVSLSSLSLDDFCHCSEPIYHLQVSKPCRKMQKTLLSPSFRFIWWGNWRTNPWSIHSPRNESQSNTNHTKYLIKETWWWWQDFKTDINFLLTVSASIHCTCLICLNYLNPISFQQKEVRCKMTAYFVNIFHSVAWFDVQNPQVVNNDLSLAGEQ